MKKVFTTIALAAALLAVAATSAGAQSVPPPPPPGGGAAGGGHGGMGGAGLALGCGFGATGSVMIGAALPRTDPYTRRSRQMTPREAIVAAGYGCYGAPGVIADAVLPPDNRCTYKVAADAFERWHHPKYPEELAWNAGGVQGEFQGKYYDAYSHCTPAKHKKFYKKHRRYHTHRHHHRHHRR